MATQTSYSAVPVVAQQPIPMQTTTTSVIVHQPASNWNSGLCDCCQDIKSFCCAFWLGNCYYACISARMGENCCVGCSGYPAGCVPGGHLAMRSSFRAKHGIPGSICDDCCHILCCLPCSMCQISREMDHLGYPEKNSCS